IVGVVRDTPNNGLHEPPLAAMYVPSTLQLGDTVTLMVRTTRNPLMMTPTIRRVVQDVDPSQPVNLVRTGEDVLEEAGWARERFVAVLLAAFSLLALVLASVGLYSVVAYAVARRVREFGIRSALGAGATSIVGTALKTTSLAIAVGLVAGLGLSLVSDRIVA